MCAGKRPLKARCSTAGMPTRLWSVSTPRAIQLNWPLSSPRTVRGTICAAPVRQRGDALTPTAAENCGAVQGLESLKDILLSKEILCITHLHHCWACTAMLSATSLLLLRVSLAGQARSLSYAQDEVCLGLERHCCGVWQVNTLRRLAHAGAMRGWACAKPY